MKQLTLIYITIAALTFLLSAFYAVTFDISKWPKDTRAFDCAIMAASFLLLLIVHLIREDEREDI